MFNHNMLDNVAKLNLSDVWNLYDVSEPYTKDLKSASVKQEA